MVLIVADEAGKYGIVATVIMVATNIGILGVKELFDLALDAYDIASAHNVVIDCGPSLCEVVREDKGVVLLGGEIIYVI